MYNMLNFTAGSIPVTKVTEEDLRNMKDYATPDPWHAVPKKVGVSAVCFFLFNMLYSHICPVKTLA